MDGDHKCRLMHGLGLETFVPSRVEYGRGLGATGDNVTTSLQGKET